MNTFKLALYDSYQSRTIDDVTSFVAEDASGSFGIQAGHLPIMTNLVFGLARFSTAVNRWQYLALPGAILHFHDNLLTLNTRRFLISQDYEQVKQALTDTLAAEEEQLAAMKRNLRNIESQILKRLLEVRGEI